MLQAHSYLWHYLWVAPNVLLLVLGLMVWRKLLRDIPAFLAFVVLGALSELTLYFADIAPWISGSTWWRVDWACLVVEGLVKFVLISALFAKIFGSYASIAQLGRTAIRAVGVLLVLTAAIAAAYAPKQSLFGLVSGAHVLDQTVYLIEVGLLIFIFSFAFYFRLTIDRLCFGIALGLGVSACVHLATWALMANGELSNPARYNLDFLNMATYHVCVLIWFYYLLVPRAVVAKSAVPLPENHLDVWNRELERLVHQ